LLCNEGQRHEPHWYAGGKVSDFLGLGVVLLVIGFIPAWLLLNAR